MPVTSRTQQKPIRFVTDRRLDFAYATPLRKSYFIASSYRSGSQYLCWLLWQTGVLGAPCEYLNPTYELRILKERFGVQSHSDYIATLLARRTSRNGVFGMKAHFHHFEAFVKDYPALLEVLSPVSYVYISRNDKIAQAVSMAKALQTGWWTSRMQEGPPPPLRYDREMIAKCLDEIEQQDLNWRRWFECYRFTPFPVAYDELTADAGRVVRGIVELLGVENDAPERVEVPPAKKQGDDTNQEWIHRFRREMPAGRGREAVDPGGSVVAVDTQRPADEAHFCNRYERLVKRLSEGTKPGAGPVAATRLRRRYEAIISRNRGVFRNARVLDVMSSQGVWSLAVLDAGASHVVGVEISGDDVKAAHRTFAEYGIKPTDYEFVNSGVFAALKNYGPGSFDVILCSGFAERCHFPELFRHLVRLRPKHVVLDTRIASGSGPMIQYAAAAEGGIISAPSHQLIAVLCEREFRCRLVDWHSIGITDWTGVHDYEHDRRRTYVLDRLAS